MEGRKQCLYEVLSIPRDSSHDKICAAYKRLGLQLHPDKVATFGTSAVATTAAFQELRHAYEILFSDPSTSKSHRPSAFFDLDLYAFFSNSAFSGYSDADKGFYKVYSDIFTKVYAQELWFAKEMGLGADAISIAPLIGNLDSPYSQVTAFYNYWLGFCIVMDFGWVDEYEAVPGMARLLLGHSRHSQGSGPLSLGRVVPSTAQCPTLSITFRGLHLTIVRSLSPLIA